MGDNCSELDWIYLERSKFVKIQLTANCVLIKTSDAKPVTVKPSKWEVSIRVGKGNGVKGRGPNCSWNSFPNAGQL